MAEQNNDALGMIETKGLVPAIEAADATLNSTLSASSPGSVCRATRMDSSFSSKARMEAASAAIPAMHLSTKLWQVAVSSRSDSSTLRAIKGM